jgi:glycosyltransferase involved in cell wall biosynthesis
MHSIYAMFKNPTLVDGNFYDAVIPGYLEPEMFPLQEKKEDYYLYVGRMVDRKGIGIAQHVCKEMGLKLIMAGPGKDPKIEYGEWVGPVGPEERAKLMGGAIALFAPTLYIEPFGNVVIEAQACGTPTITTDWGAFTETNPQGVTGYRCRNAMEFAVATEWVKKLDPVAIHKRAVALYSLEAIAPQYEQYFARLLTLWGDGWYERK